MSYASRRHPRTAPWPAGRPWLVAVLLLTGAYNFVLPLFSPPTAVPLWLALTVPALLIATVLVAVWCSVRDWRQLEHLKLAMSRYATLHPAPKLQGGR